MRSLNAAILTWDTSNDDLTSLEMFKCSKAQRLLASGSADAARYFQQYPRWSNCFSEAPVPTTLPFQLSPSSFKSARLGLGQMLLAEHSFTCAYPQAVPALARRLALRIDEFEALGDTLATFIRSEAEALCRGLAARPAPGCSYPGKQFPRSLSFGEIAWRSALQMNVVDKAALAQGRLG